MVVQTRSELAALYDPAYLELDLYAYAQRFQERYQSLLRYLRPQYHQDIHHLRSLLLPGQRRTRAQLQADVSRGAKALAIEDWLREHWAEHAHILEHYFDGAKTDWPRVRAAADWMTEFHTCSRAIQPSPMVLSLITGADRALMRLRELYSRLLALWNEWQYAVTFLSRIFDLEALLSERATFMDAEITQVQAALTQVHIKLRAFWQAADTIMDQRLPGTPSPTWSELCADLQIAQGMSAIRAWFADHSSELALHLGKTFIGIETDWSRLLQGLDWVETLLQLYPHREIPAALVQAIVQEGDEAQRQRLYRAQEAVSQSLEIIEEELRFSDQILPRQALLPIDATAFDNVPLLALYERIVFLIEQLPCLERWLACAQQLQHCRDVGLSDLVEIILRERPFPRDIVDRFAKRFYTLWLDFVYQQSPVLARFRREVYEHTIARFCELDERHAKLAQERLCASLRQRRREALAALDTGNIDACARAILALKSEVAKKRHRSIRSIVQKTAPGLLALKPCWMMSPLSVSQFLESGAPVFDLVIFDEASQVGAEDAICAILRGKQLIVVGDSKQLPPTRFFAKTLADIEDEDQPDDAHDQPGSERMESILDECLGASFPQRSLLWHYRSRHESLIAFSNHHFYYGRLITFPSPDARHSNGVRFEYVPDGIYDYGRSRTNRREAERVVDLILQHMQQQSGLSLGVVALSEAQQRAIQEAIEERLKCHPELRAWEKELNEDNPAGFFIKNLESVQGDERDVIILSVGYGPDANGRVHLNFGPVNRKGGERRLNVAVTRARHQVIVVSSMRAEDLPRELASPGAQALRNYLEYAARGPAVLSNLMLTGNKDAEDSHQTWQFASPFEEAVYSALTARGLLLDTQVGCSGYRIDMAVRDAQHPGRYLLGIECDGTTYHSSYTAHDRDRLRQRQLEKMGWTIHRIWSTDWARNPAGEVEKVLAKLH